MSGRDSVQVGARPRNTPLTHKDVNGQMRPGTFVHFQGLTYRVDAAVDWDLNAVALRDTVTGECVDVSILDLLICGSDTTATIFAPTLAVLDARLAQSVEAPPLASTGGVEEFTDDADEIIRVVEIVEAALKRAEGLATAAEERFLRRTAVIDEVLEDPASNIGIKRAMYYRYLERYRACGGSRARIVGSFKRASRDRTTLSKAQVHFADMCAMRFHSIDGNVAELYRDMEDVLRRTRGLWPDADKCNGPIRHDLVDLLLDKKLRMADIEANAERWAMLAPLELPSYPWVIAHLREIRVEPDAGKIIMLDKYGRQVWEREYMVYDTFVHLASLPLQYVFLDHYKLDIFTLDEANRRKRTRLWLTVGFDAFSRCVPGFILLPEDPCIESVQGCLLDFIWPSSEKRPYCGIPRQVFLDNAWAHHSHSVENLAREIGRDGEYTTIDLVFRPPYQARKGALVERFFGNLSRKIKDGSCPHLVKRIRGWIEPA